MEMLNQAEKIFAALNGKTIRKFEFPLLLNLQMAQQ